MAVENPTFSESWYRVAALRPRLRATVQVRRQHFRGRIWHVVQDPVNNQFFRLHPAAYRFVGMLDGRRTVSQVWRSCNERLGDEALTQNEAIGVLGQLYAANLLQANLPPDAEGLFQRYRKRRSQQVRGQVANFLFVRVPLFDPDRLLDALVGVAGLAFTPVGLVAWLAVLAVGGWFAFGAWRELAAEGEELLRASRLVGNLPLMYAAFLAAKVLHEFAHGVACKKFGRRVRGGGEVHTMGIMFLVFAPMPYVDASSAWALRSKLHRVVIGAAGMMAELALAAAAVVVWAWTADAADPWLAGVHAVAYNVLLIASVSTLLFNGNFLLRFDGYYILSDLLGIPNLWSRSRQYVCHLVKRYAWGVRQSIDPANSAGEAAWLFVYGVASTAFRVLICVKILLMLMDRFFYVGAGLATAAAVTWVVLPLGRLVHYLAASGELTRRRGLAVASTVAVLAAGVGSLGMLDAPDRWRIEGVVEGREMAYVHARADGFVRDVLPSGRPVVAGGQGRQGTVVVAAVNRELETSWKNLLHERAALEARQRIARLRSVEDRRYKTLVQILERDLAHLDRQRRLLAEERASLSIPAPRTGTWVSRHADRLAGTYVRRGESLGQVVSLDRVVIRARASQRLAGMLIAEPAASEVAVRVAGRPGTVSRGTWRIRPAGQRGGEAAGRGAAAGTAGRAGEPASPRQFDIEVTPLDRPGWPLLPGQRVVVQFQMPRRPLLGQWWRSLRQMAQRRFRI